MPVKNYITNGLVWHDSLGQSRAIPTVDNTKIHVDECRIDLTSFENPITTVEMRIDGIANREFIDKYAIANRELIGKFLSESLLYDPRRLDGIKKIYVNEKKRTVVVIFDCKFRVHNKNYNPASDLEWDKYITTNKIVVKCNSEENFDVYRAVSSACMIKKYGSNSAFKSYIRKTMGVYSDSLYDVIAWHLTSVMFGSWNKFLEAVDEAREDSHGKREETNTK